MSNRRAAMAKIHIAKKELGLTDDQYRYTLHWKFKKNSAKDLSDRQITVLLNHFKAKGWKPKRATKSGKSRAMASDPMSRKIRALWITMGKMGVVKNTSEKSLAAYVKRMTKVDDLRWANEYQKGIVIESLKRWIAREEGK